MKKKTNTAQYESLFTHEVCFQWNMQFSYFRARLRLDRTWCPTILFVELMRSKTRYDVVSLQSRQDNVKYPQQREEAGGSPLRTYGPAQFTLAQGRDVTTSHQGNNA